LLNKTEGDANFTRLNNELAQAESRFYGDVDPSTIDGVTVGPGFEWAHESAGVTKRRNAANNGWVVVGPLFSELATKSSVDAKVDKVTGKGLSTEDYTTAEQTKLAGVEENATANSSDSYLLDRANHTGQQSVSTLSDLSAATTPYDGTETGLPGNLQDAVDAAAIKYSVEIPTTSGTQIDMSGIPETARRIVVQFVDVSLTGTSPVCLQLGTSAGVLGSNYAETSSVTNNTTVSTIYVALGFCFSYPIAATDANSGKVFLDRFGDTNIWTAHGGTRQNQTRITTVAGQVLLPGGLDRIRLRPYNGTDTFDNGSIVVTWEA
jgi:hypothetical protein